ncbi:dysbindin protein homolog isoform X2 [Glossina fuscipes]|uniref:Dysbindin protein homolog isoform X2 n=1 Tax=Glossina fuscipes TaxID=7396 RepID=A0A8U0W922_9MUSC|nr:dysbindin protein homolog isoform X2 [Glossina fuscipes]
MFSNLKRKLNYAMQEGLTVTENLQQQYRQRVSNSKNPTNSSNSSLVSSISELGVPSNVNASAGCKILSKYEHDWQMLHQNNEENSKKAAELAEQIDNIEQKMSNHQIIIADLLTSLAGLPNLTEKLKSCQHTLVEVQELHKLVERDFEKLEDLCEECDFQEFRWQKHVELAKYKQKKMEDLELFRQKLVLEQEQRIHNHEMKLQQIQKERQAVFEDAFQYDLLEYKRTGQVPNKDLNSAVTLEEIVLDDNETKDALEEFLNG